MQNLRKYFSFFLTVDNIFISLYDIRILWWASFWLFLWLSRAELPSLSTEMRLCICEHIFQLLIIILPKAIVSCLFRGSWRPHRTFQLNIVLFVWSIVAHIYRRLVIYELALCGWSTSWLRHVFSFYTLLIFHWYLCLNEVFESHRVHWRVAEGVWIGRFQTALTHIIMISIMYFSQYYYTIAGIDGAYLWQLLFQLLPEGLHGRLSVP